jgi:hypothetical protein
MVPNSFLEHPAECLASFRVSLCTGRFYTVSDQNSGSFPADLSFMDLGSLAGPAECLASGLVYVCSTEFQYKTV